MPATRRLLLAAGLAAALPLAGFRAAQAQSRSGAAPARVRPDAEGDQTAALQRAVDQAAESRVALTLPAGSYRIAGLRLRSHSRLVGIPGATRLVAAGNGPLLICDKSDGVSLQGLVCDGRGHAAAGGGGVVTFSDTRNLSIADCDILDSAGNGLHLEACQGAVTGCTITGHAKTGLFSRNAEGLRITDNTVARIGNNGIQVWRSTAGHDGTLVTGNRILDIAARDGGSGQNGNAINLFRADGVVVANNSVRGCAYSAVRANTASGIQILGNNCSRIGEVALYVEFGSQGAIVANNLVDGASIGLSMTNFNEGGRLAVAQGNLFRNLLLPPTAGNDPDGGWGIGIHVEADAAVTGNVIENAANMGISIGWAQHLRDVNASSNVIRDVPVGIGVSVTAGAGAAVIKDNLITGARRGGVLGFDHKRAVTGDLARDGAASFSQLTVTGNVVR